MRLITEQLPRLPAIRGGDGDPENLIETISMICLRSETLSVVQDDFTKTECNRLSIDIQNIDISTLIDRIIGRLGKRFGDPPGPPGKPFARAGASPHTGYGGGCAGTGNRRPLCHAAPLCHTTVMRPPRLLSRPEPVTVMAPVPPTTHR